MLLYALVGIAFLLSYPLSFLRVMINFTPIAYPFKLKLRRYLPKRPDQHPSWVVVTGPTGDLGKEFSFQLAKKGFSVFLVGRSKEKLDALVKDCLEEAKLGKSKGNGVRIKAHQIDIGSASDADWDKLDKALDALPGRITILLNNAGVSHRRFVPFEKTPVEDLKNIPAVNVVGVLRITRLIVPRMIAQRCGLILNIGSFSSHVPAPLLATYAGSKAFLYTFSQALGAQLERKGVEVRVLNTLVDLLSRDVHALTRLCLQLLRRTPRFSSGLPDET